MDDVTPTVEIHTLLPVLCDGFPCPNGTCINPELLCNGEDDRGDMADEHNCTKCHKDDFKCRKVTVFSQAISVMVTMTVETCRMSTTALNNHAPGLPVMMDSVSVVCLSVTMAGTVTMALMNMIIAVISVMT